MLSPPGPRTDRSTTARISDNTQTVRPYGCNQVSGSNQDIHRTQYKRPAQLAFYTVGTAGFETHDPLTPQGGWDGSTMECHDGLSAKAGVVAPGAFRIRLTPSRSVALAPSAPQPPMRTVSTSPPSASPCGWVASI